MPDISDDSKLAKLASDLKSELDEVYAANQRTAEAYDRAVLQRDQLAGQADALADKIDLLESEVDSVADAREKLQSKLDSAASSRRDAEAQLELALQDLKTQNEKLSASLQTVTSREAELLDRSETLASELAKVQASLQSADHEVSRLTEQLLQNADELSAHKSAHADLQQETSRLVDVIDQLEGQRHDSIEQTKELQLANERQLHKAAAVESELRSSLEQAARENAVIQTDFTALQKDRESLTEVLARERADRALSDRSTTKLVEALTNQLKTARDELATAKIESKHVLIKAQSLSDQAGVSASELRQTEGLLSNFVRELENTGSELKERTAELQQLSDAKRSSDQQMTDRIRDLETLLSVARQHADESDDALRQERSINVELTRKLASQASISKEDSPQHALTPKPSCTLEGVDDQTNSAGKNDSEKPAEAKNITKPTSDPNENRSTKRRTSTREVDDLTVIEGIGPKIRDLLIEKRITTFKKLSTMDLVQLERILTKAGMSLKRHDPTNWPEQAKLAADGNFDRLKELKQNLAKSWVTNCVRPVH